jgi:hypothetical protein
VLARTDIIDAGLEELTWCPHLTFISLVRADKLTNSGVGKLRMAKPQLQIQR